jgi:hypothetical protein
MPHTLSADIEEIAQDLIDAFALEFSGTVGNLTDPLIRWLDYRLRYIDPSPRQVLKSVEFDARVPPEARQALDTFITHVESGADVNPYQTKTIKRNDTSGTKRQLRTDGMWADWRIHHAHLIDLPVATGAEFSERSDWLLFFLVLPEHIALIDVRSHSEPNVFQAVDLVEKLIRSWPQIAEPFAVKGVLGLARPPSTDPSSLRDLRVGGVTQMLEVDGKVYLPPGFGVTSAATSTQVSLMRDKVKRFARHIADFFMHSDSQLMQAAAGKGIASPVVSLCVLPTGQLAISWQGGDIAIPFPSPPKPSDARSELEHLLLPQWARAKLVTHLSAKQASAQANSP